MTLAPIRGAPLGAPNPDFPIDNQRVRPAQPTAKPISGNQPTMPPVRQRHTPIEISGGGVTFTFRVIPEQPAIARASLTVHIAAEAPGASPTHTLGFLRMSASSARIFLTDVLNGRSPIVATGDEDGDVQIEYESTKAGPVLMVLKRGGRDVLHHRIIDRKFDLKMMADDLLGDLGA